MTKGVEIRISRIHIEGIGIKYDVKRGDIVTVLKVEAIIPPVVLARICNLERQEAPLDIVIESPQVAFDLQMETINTETGELVSTKKSMAEVA